MRRVHVSILLMSVASALHAQRPVPGNRPLIIVDGVIVSETCEPLDGPPAAGTRVRINNVGLGQIAGLSPGDIENVEVLKGDAPARLYGADAAHGVIVVTTKKGRHYCFDVAPAPNDPLPANFFPPELIMSHQRELGIQDAQRTALVNELQQTQASFVQLQWKMSAESEQLEKLVQPTTVNETLVLAQIDRVLAMEREIKRAQIGLLIRTKNLLTVQQQAKLIEIRKAAR